MRLPQVFFLITGIVLTSCGSYRQNILFQVTPDKVQAQAFKSGNGYRIEPDDLLALHVYTNQGEKLVDPNRESFGTSSGSSLTDAADFQYLVNPDGTADFPLIGRVKVGGLSLHAAEKILAQAYEKYYEGAYVVLQFKNKRVIVLGAPGGQVIPLTNENTKLTEVLALAQGITRDARATNIRVIRGDQVFVSDLSTFDGYLGGNLVMQPGDIVYVELVRRPFIEALREYSPVITVVTSLATLIFIISR